MHRHERSARHRRPLVGLQMFLQVVLASKRLGTARNWKHNYHLKNPICLFDFTWTMKRFHSCVDSSVPCQLLIPCESLSTGRMRTSERPFPGVDPHVASQLPVVAEPRTALVATELLRPGSSLVQLQLMGKIFCC